ncbi:MAG: hypothetical protein ACI8UR_002257 [Natronomonas sp.]|jgi:hypothetical protein|uniref:DUF7577 domain-containing protein n=1 Tax=Natronomonas sp. TaxID=2184060 RepID=UPI0039893522
METLAWAAMAAVGLALFHIAIAVYLYRAAAMADAGGREEPYASERGREPQPAQNAVTESIDEWIPCPTCGTPNDPAYRFCRRCISDLTSSKTSANAPDGTERLGS